MALTLTLRGGGMRETRTLERGNLSIGRSSGNDWVLPDPDQLLSRTHCMIAAADGHCVLTDVSTNGVFVNGSSERVARNGQVTLNDGDEFKLGDYMISVAEKSRADPDRAQIVRGPAVRKWTCAAGRGRRAPRRPAGRTR